MNIISYTKWIFGRQVPSLSVPPPRRRRRTGRESSHREGIEAAPCHFRSRSKSWIQQLPPNFRRSPRLYRRRSLKLNDHCSTFLQNRFNSTRCTYLCPVHISIFQRRICETFWHFWIKCIQNGRVCMRFPNQHVPCFNQHWQIVVVISRQLNN